MNQTRMLSLALAGVLTLGLASPAAAASEPASDAAPAPIFQDMEDYAWAIPYAEDLAAKGVVYGKGEGIFDPGGSVTALEAFAFCARMLQLEDSVQEAMEEARGDEVAQMLPEGCDWAVRELSVCLEAEVVTLAELRSLCSSGNILKALAKEDLAMLIARAMQLEGTAQTLDDFDLTYEDTDGIRDSRKAYVYLLNSYGVVQGNDANEFQPRSAVVRAVTVTMISRAMAVMEDENIVIDLPAYSSYAWTSGTVVSAVVNASGSVTLALSSPVSGEKVLNIPYDVAAYYNNAGCDLTQIIPGRWAKVVLDEKGEAAAVHLTEAPTVYTGTTDAVSVSELSMTDAEGTPWTFLLDRCTAVKAGPDAGDVSLIQTAGGYNGASVWVDGAGRTVAVVLTGGIRREEGLIGGVSAAFSGTNLELIGFDGVTKTMPMIPEASVTVNGLSGNITTLGAGYVGNYASVYVDNETDQVTAVAIDTSVSYVQGYIKSVTYRGIATNNITIVRYDDGKTSVIPLAEEVQVTYEGEPVEISELKADQMATVRLDSEKRAVSIDAYPGSSVTEGIISSISYDTITTLIVTRDDGVQIPFKLDLNDLPDFTRNGKPSTVDRLMAGDRVSVTVRHNAVSQVDTLSQEATHTGTITAVNTDLNGTALVVELSDGETVAYSVNSRVTITRDDQIVGISALQPGEEIEMVVSGEQIISIALTSSVPESELLSGMVMTADTTKRTMFLKLTNGDLMTISVPSSARIVDVNGSSSSLQKLSGTQVQVYGNYDSSGTFVATLVVRVG